MSLAASGRRFSKMHGAGNDFVVLDLRNGAPAPTADEAACMADRHRGIGCDQLLTIEPASEPNTLASYRIWNADGSAAGQCGNGARCVAAWLYRDASAAVSRFALGSPAGRIEADVFAADDVRVALSVPQFSPSDLPLLSTEEQVMYRLQDADASLAFGAVSMGNPHAVLEVPNLARAEVARIGSQLQASAQFPDSVNVGFAQVLSTDHIALRVFERGVGETLACGSGACAAVAVLVRQGRVGRRVRVDLPGGTLDIEWPSDDAPVWMRGPAAFVFEGEWIDG